MNMIKKFAMGASALALTSGLVACGDDNGGSVSDLTTTYAADGKSVAIDGQIEATSNIFDVSYILVDAKGAAITGAIYAYALKDVVTSDTVLLVNLGKDATDAPNLELNVDFTKIDPSHCGELTLTVAAQVESSGPFSSDSVEVTSSTTLKMPCGLTQVKDSVVTPNFEDVIADTLKSITVTLGGAKSSLGSSYDLEKDSMAAYTSAQVKNSTEVLNAIDVIFNGSKIMTPIGTSEVGYMSATYANSTSGAFLIPVTQDAKAVTVGDLEDLIEADKAVFSADLNATSAYLVVTSEGMPVLVKVKALDSTTQVVTISYSKKK